MDLLKIGDFVPDFEARSTRGEFRFYDWMAEGWAVLLAFPEQATDDDIDALRAIEALEPDFRAIGCKVVGCIAVPEADSENSEFDAWAGPIRKAMGELPPFPIVRQVGPGLSVFQPTDGSSDLDTRTLLVVGADKRVKLVIAIPVVTASMFGEILRLIESLQYAADRRGGKPGYDMDDIIVLPCAPANEDTGRAGRSKCRPLNGHRRKLRPRKRCG